DDRCAARRPAAGGGPGGEDEPARDRAAGAGGSGFRPRRGSLIPADPATRRAQGPSIGRDAREEIAMKKWMASLFALALLVAGLPAGAQALQGGPLKIVVPYPPGGSSDRAARLLSERLSTEIGAPVIVENRPGA